MGAFRMHRLWEFFSGTSLVVAMLWVGLLGLSIVLFILSRTRWGQARPLRKCLVLSVLVHLLLAGYATTVRIVQNYPFTPPEPVVRVWIAEAPSSPEQSAPRSDAKKMPWESYGHDSSVEPVKLDVVRAEPVAVQLPERQPRADKPGVSQTTLLDRAALAEPVRAEPKSLPNHASTPTPHPGGLPEPIDSLPAQRRDPNRLVIREPDAIQRPRDNRAAAAEPPRTNRAGRPSSLLEQQLPMPRLSNVSKTPEPESVLDGKTDLSAEPSRGQLADLSNNQPVEAEPPSQTPPDAGEMLAQPRMDHVRLPSPTLSAEPGPKASLAAAGSGVPDIGPPLLRANRHGDGEHQVPTIYSLRLAPDRSRRALRNGATLDTEVAVKAALDWLADHQEPDGRWSAKAHGAGKELLVAGRDRMGAGIEADTGVTGLALLAFLASGHTHQQGEHQSTVLRGLEFLIGSQQADGSLGGKATSYAFMYCHAIATFALSEAFGMTGDPQLADAVLQAVAYTLAAQNPSTGGWRYKPGDDGDTSLLGWQIMGLKSAELAGIPIPTRTRSGALRFLDAASAGSHRGLTAYRPAEQPSRPMTAEALACRIFLGMDPLEPAAKEAGAYLLGELPGEGRVNLYYWYYATLGMYQLQGVYWRQWNDALKRTLLASQEKNGPMAGSWSPDTVWGGYGGRVYSTSLAALCLEVYYRFLPLYENAASVDAVRR
jgi:hypothetical protein